MANGMEEIRQAMQKKNTMMSAAGAAKGGQAPQASQAPASPVGSGSNDPELQRILKDDNKNATPAKNAIDIDIMDAHLMEILDTLDIIMPGLDELKGKVDIIWEALHQSGGGQQPPAPPVPPIPGKV